MNAEDNVELDLVVRFEMGELIIEPRHATTQKLTFEFAEYLTRCLAPLKGQAMTQALQAQAQDIVTRAVLDARRNGDIR